ncbi:SpaA isopeptide-forming pilin-related protein [Streptomyces sp. NPDC054835]|uniref:SpaA isopeptide-forming pilin-related protein n=1 Tax=Streptomyces exfoliatus TaxID=1905 RepID=UPI000464E731|nr:SpaA isopeptide-forming pilin-related protein [Streptomyces exfoliatus]
MPLHRTPLVITLTAATALTAVPLAVAAPAPTPSTAATQSSESAPVDVGGLRIIKTDPEGKPVDGTAFQLLDTTGKTLADGTTGSDGTLTLTGLVPGIARLKETASGSPVLDTVPDQDVVIVPGPPTDLPITDPYKAASLTLKVTDKTTGKGLAGAVANVIPKGAKDNKGTFTLTTGKDGTAKAPLPVGRMNGTTYTITQTKAPAGHRPQTASVDVTALPGQPVAASLVNTATTTAPPTQKPTTRPTASASGQPIPSGSPSASSPAEEPLPSSSASAPADSDAATGSASPTGGPSPTGSLAHTGSSSTTIALLSGGATLLLAGAATVYLTRRRRKADRTLGSGQHRRSNTV